MKSLLGSLLLTGLCVSCAVLPVSKREEFVAAKNSIDVNLDDATIEDYILALPAFTFHEESVEQFHERVKKARADNPKNQERDRNSLYVEGDGSWPAKDFYLDRKTRTLRIRVYSREPGKISYDTAMRRVAGGWLRRPDNNTTTEQADTNNRFSE